MNATGAKAEAGGGGEAGPVDVVIPVWNAPEATRRCIDALYRHAAPYLGRVRVEDDASGRETARMLDALERPGLVVRHAPENRGFGATVNAGVAAARSERVLVLNSDAELGPETLPALARALDADPGLAAVNPAAEDFARLDLGRYLRRAGCVRSFNLKGFAFLLRRRAFLEVGGFDAKFGRGYYEDRALSRELVAAGWRLGIVPESRIRHQQQASFVGHPDLERLIRTNRERYYRLYPEATCWVAVVSDARELETFPAAARDSVEAVLRRGGRVRWLRPGRPRRLLSPEMDARALGPSQLLRLVGRDRLRRRWTGLWLVGAPPGGRAPFRLLGGLRGLEMRHWSRA